jgi:hypothetical protein
MAAIGGGGAESEKEAEEAAEQDHNVVEGGAGAAAEKAKNLPPTMIFFNHAHLHQREQMLKAPTESRNLPRSPFPKFRVHRGHSSLSSAGCECSQPLSCVFAPSADTM